ncbi:hypothetical protein DFQ28_006947 [Apophysomyces sp. BC1034]|nr:hypothetical protein DFQ30_004720 [Apophysomyces sp. BC1015]KAG0177278.1 hypothetical protein DFQ29_005034 [Apophysomyces sp. BC1021]KAG0187046.1 hypothetical protein DFQ28_006947 [Apophysomyces sp. BC1034]
MAKKRAEPLISRIPRNKPENVPESEQQRIIEQTGLLEKVKKREAELAVRETTSAEFFWQAIFLSIPFGFLLAAFEVTVKVQYSETWTSSGIVLKAIKSAPALLPFIYLSNRYKNSQWMQAMMSISSVVIGSFLLYTLQHSPSLGQMLRAPGLATIWVYLIVQLNLLPATLTLAMVGLYWHFGLNDKK